MISLGTRERPGLTLAADSARSRHRGFALPLLFYGSFVWVVEKSRPHELASAIGWTRAMFAIGYGIAGLRLPGFTIVWIGSMGTLWMAWVPAGGLLIFFLMLSDPQLQREVAEHRGTQSGKLAEVSKSVALVFHTSSRIGFSVPEWARIWGTFSCCSRSSTSCGDSSEIGWMRQLRWVSFVGCGTASLFFY
jgi:hypothetical protein